MGQKSLTELKTEIQIKAKNGIDFILSACIVWFIISYLWTLEYTSYNLSVFTFMVGAILLPLAFGLSKILKTNWKVKDNPLQPLGLWLNFAQLIYFPFLIFILIKYPDYFIMAYAIITGAHLFPYAWLYDEIGYAIWAIVISLGALVITLNIELDQIWFVPFFTSIMLFTLACWILLKLHKQKNETLSKNE
jgi:hypothetical protein